MGKRLEDYHAFSVHMKSQDESMRAYWANPPQVPAPMTEAEVFEWVLPVQRARQEFLKHQPKADVEIQEDGRFRRVLSQGIPICSYEGARPSLSDLREIVRRNLMDDATRTGLYVQSMLERSLAVPEGHCLSSDIKHDVRFIEHVGSTQISFYILPNKPKFDEDARREWECSHSWIEAEFRMKFAESSAHVWLREVTRNPNPSPQKGEMPYRLRDIEGEGNKFLYCSDHQTLAETICTIHNVAVERYRGFEEGFAENIETVRMKG